VQPLIREGSRSSASFRHQVFSTSRRLSPHSGLRAYSIPLPRPGFPPVQGLLSPRSSPFLIGRSCPLAVASRSNLTDLRRLPAIETSASRPSSARGRVRCRAVIHSPACRSPPRVHLLQALSSLGWTRLTRVVRSRRSFATPSLSRSRVDLVHSVSPERSRLRVSARPRLLEISGLLSKPPCSRSKITARCLAMLLFGASSPPA
jgi:hypothetical protein